MPGFVQTDGSSSRKGEGGQRPPTFVDDRLAATSGLRQRLYLHPHQADPLVPSAGVREATSQPNADPGHGDVRSHEIEDLKTQGRRNVNAAAMPPARKAMPTP